ncbi:hypothetical protein OH76DRAFT_1003106 [Lentinus brumalis]|uniref:Uncharacterized protein n=1 Tax=Lentinus brumalis TaxID=2498619 RepID=A0A371CYF5_9APHY|nr:hypothetical protein OH76DRAFT_1003106 [Polyporus brumalis]
MPRARRRSVTRPCARWQTRPRESRGCADERISPFAGTRPVVLVWPATDSSDPPGRLRRCPRPRPATQLVCDLQREQALGRPERRASRVRGRAGVRADAFCCSGAFCQAGGALGAHLSAVY